MKFSLPKQVCTSQGFTHPFTAGLASVFVLVPDMKQKSIARRVLNRSDAVAMKSDWQDVGSDLHGAMRSASNSGQAGKGQMAFEWSESDGS